MVRHDLSRVENRKRCPTKGVRDAVEEDEDDGTDTDTVVASGDRVIGTGETSETSEGHHHTGRRPYELSAAIEAICHQSTGVGHDPGQAFLTEVKLELLPGVADTDVREDLRQVIAD